MKINKTYPYNLRNDAHFQFYTEFRSLVQKEGAEKLKIEALPWRLQFLAKATGTWQIDFMKTDKFFRKCDRKLSKQFRLVETTNKGGCYG